MSFLPIEAPADECPDLALSTGPVSGAAGEATANLPARPTPELPLPMYNHAEFAAKVDRALADCRRHRTRLAVLLIAADAVNRVDEQGNLLGEAAVSIETDVLEKFALRLHRRVRSTDQMVRLDSRTIGIVLAGAGGGAAFAVGGRTMKALGGPYRLETDLLQLRLRVGQATYPEHVTGKELVHAALRALSPVA